MSAMPLAEAEKQMLSKVPLFSGLAAGEMDFLVPRIVPRNSLHALERLQKSKPGQSRRAAPKINHLGTQGCFRIPLFYFQNKHSSQQLLLRFYDKRIRHAAGVLNNKVFPPWLAECRLWVVAMLKQLFPMYWVESAGGLL